MTSRLSFAIFLIFIIILFFGLFTDTRKISSPLINKTLPQFNYPALRSMELVTNSNLPNETILLNIWASWCKECIREHQVLNAIAQEGNIKIIGINYKDKRTEALGWLDIYGSPYVFSINDSEGKLGLDLGVYGVPETFIVDKNGYIRAKYIGAITFDLYMNEILPLIKELSYEE